MHTFRKENNQMFYYPEWFIENVTLNPMLWITFDVFCREPTVKLGLTTLFPFCFKLLDNIVLIEY